LRFLTAATLVVVSVAVPSRLGSEPRPLLRAEAEPGACLAAGCPEAVRRHLVAWLEDHLLERMSGAGQEVQEAVALALALEAEAVRVDPLLVLAMIEVESGFDPAAASGAGAQGLMQLLPATLRREATALGLGEVDPRDPVANVRSGVRYLRRCLDSYPGHLELALVAYNAGPNRVFDLLQEGGLPAWALAYPRRVEAERRRLQDAFEQQAGPRLADARRDLP
jgi:hypothetical protein